MEEVIDLTQIRLVISDLRDASTIHKQYFSTLSYNRATSEEYFERMKEKYAYHI